jgi:hypothetical protein
MHCASILWQRDAFPCWARIRGIKPLDPPLACAARQACIKKQEAVELPCPCCGTVYRRSELQVTRITHSGDVQSTMDTWIPVGVTPYIRGCNRSRLVRTTVRERGIWIRREEQKRSCQAQALSRVAA